MPVYMIGYDLHPSSREDYDKLYTALEAVGCGYWDCLESTWLVITEKTPAQIGDELSPTSRIRPRRALSRGRAKQRAQHLALGARQRAVAARRHDRRLAPGGRPSDKAREARLMVQEKVDAVVEGAFAAQAAWGAFLLRAAFGGVRTPNDVSMGLASIAHAAAAPARRKVRANARRLTGAKAFP